MARPNNTTPTLAGVQLYYDRRSLADIGHGTQVSLSMTQNTEDKLDRCFSELWDVCPLGTAKKIFTAGAYVNKGGMHGAGRAFDLDGF